MRALAMAVTVIGASTLLLTSEVLARGFQWRGGGGWGAGGQYGRLYDAKTVESVSGAYLRGLLIGRHNESRGHLDCRGMLLSEAARIHAIPELTADRAPRSVLSHEAAVGPIDEEAVEYLMTRGRVRDAAVSLLVRGFLKLEIPGLPAGVTRQIDRVLGATAGRSL